MNTIKKNSIVRTLVPLVRDYDKTKVFPVGTVGQVVRKHRVNNGRFDLKSLEVYIDHHRFLLSEKDVELAPIVKSVPKVGDVFYTSWGYEQTNIDFYQVVDVKGESVVIRPIADETVDYANLSGKKKAKKDSFTGTPMTKRLRYSENGNPSFKIASYAWAHPDRDGEHFFSEWH